MGHYTRSLFVRKTVDTIRINTTLAERQMAERSLFRPRSIHIYSYLQVCGRLQGSCKYVQVAPILGWDHGLS